MSFQKRWHHCQCYVDDFLVFSETSERIDQLTQKFGKDRIMEDLGMPPPFLGIEIRCQMDSIWLTQKQLMNKLLKDNTMDKTKSVRSSTNANFELNMKNELALNPNDAKRYRSIVGNILKIAIKTRPDLYVVASSLGAHVESRSPADMMAAKRALRYSTCSVDCLTK